MKNHKITIFCIIAFVLLTGCSYKYKHIDAPVFKKIENIAKDRSLIVIYSPSSRKGGFYQVNINNESPGVIVNGGYFAYYTKPGALRVWSKMGNVSEVNIDAEPGKIYFVKCEIKAGFWQVNPNLFRIPENQALKEITKCYNLSFIPQNNN